jgi:hypothetical protein
MCRVILIWFLISIFSCASNVTAQDKKKDLAVTAKEFFTVWLLKRDVEKALKFVSPNAVIGSCMTPKHLEAKKTITRAEILGVFRQLLGNREQIPLAVNLDQLIGSHDTDLFSDETIIPVTHSLDKYFRIFTLKPLADPLDNGYVCKFDERISFRKVVARPDVHYLITRIKPVENCPSVILTTLWAKEGDVWRILTMDTSTDDGT